MLRMTPKGNLQVKTEIKKSVPLSLYRCFLIFSAWTCKYERFSPYLHVLFIFGQMRQTCQTCFQIFPSETHIWLKLTQIKSLVNKVAGKLYLRLWGFIRVGGLPRPLWPRSDHRLFSLRAGVVFEFRLPAPLRAQSPITTLTAACGKSYLNLYRLQR